MTKLTTRQFIEAVYSHADSGWLTLFSIDARTSTRTTDWFPVDRVGEMAARAVELADTSDVWFGVASRYTRLGEGLRGGALDCAYITGVWADIDVAGPNHKGNKLYPDDAAAKAMIKGFPLAATIVVRTGGGYHAYWLLDEAIDRADAEPLLARWGAHWANYAQGLGYAIDNVFDLPRVLRVPGTINHKNGAEQPVVVVHYQPECVYSHSDIIDNTDDPPPPPEHVARSVPYTGTERPGDDFNARHTGADVFVMDGWTLGKDKRTPGEQRWLHPWGPSSDESATVYPDGHAVIWSDTVPQHRPAIEVRRPYDPFGLYARLIHDGDLHAATIELAKQGYGAQSMRRMLGCSDIPVGGDTPLSDDQHAAIEAYRGKHQIIVGGARHLDDIANELTGALVDINDPPHLFKHGDVVSQFTRGELEAVDRVRMVNVIETHMRPVVLKKESLAPARVEVAAIDLALLRLVDRLPEVQGVVRSPFLRADGTVCAEAGYDVRSGNYLAATTSVAVPDEPSAADVAAAVALVDDMIHDFPLKSKADRAHVFALLLTPLVRHLVPLTPLFIMDGNGPGVGKNLLAESCMFVATGEWVQTDPLPTDAEEQRKQITALMSTGRPVALFDEAHIITGTSLARLITSTTWGDRLLGYSKQVSYPNRITVVALGNNVDVQGDMPRRSILVRLESQLARPYDRQDFRHDDLREWVVDHRPELIAALLTILVSWHRAGRPKGVARLGSFDAWASIVGGALEHAGISGFMSNVAEMRQRGATDEQDMACHLWELVNFYGDRGFTAKQVAGLLEEDRLEALPPRMGRDRNYAQSLGHVYRHYSDRWMDGVRIRQDGVTHGARRWVVETLSVDNSVDSGGDGGLGGLLLPTHEKNVSPVRGTDGSWPFLREAKPSPPSPPSPPDAANGGDDLMQPLSVVVGPDDSDDDLGPF